MSVDRIAWEYLPIGMVGLCRQDGSPFVISQRDEEAVSYLLDLVDWFNLEKARFEKAKHPLRERIKDFQQRFADMYGLSPNGLVGQLFGERTLHAICREAYKSYRVFGSQKAQRCRDVSFGPIDGQQLVEDFFSTNHLYPMPNCSFVEASSKGSRTSGTKVSSIVLHTALMALGTRQKGH